MQENKLLRAALRAHQVWLDGRPGIRRGDLSDQMDLADVDLDRSLLSAANLYEVDMEDISLFDPDYFEAQMPAPGRKPAGEPWWARPAKAELIATA